jgi:hypothetical protein
VAVAHDNLIEVVEGVTASAVGALGTFPTVTTFIALETGPVPFELMAETRNQYFVPAARPVVKLYVRDWDADFVTFLNVVPFCDTWIR